jgi:hypothetical protein
MKLGLFTIAFRRKGKDYVSACSNIDRDPINAIATNVIGLSSGGSL